MIEIKLSSNEFDELQRTLPNFDVILKAIKNNPMISLIIDDDRSVECYASLEPSKSVLH